MDEWEKVQNGTYRCGCGKELAARHVARLIQGVVVYPGPVICNGCGFEMRFSYYEDPSVTVSHEIIRP